VKSLRRRPLRATPSIVVALVILAVGILLTIAGIQKLSTGQWWPQLTDAANSASSAAWNSSWGWGVAIASAVLGVILLLCAIIPGGFNAAMLGRQPEPTSGARGPIDAVVDNRGLATLASAAAAQVDGVAGVKSTATPKKVTVQITTPLRSTEALVGQVQQAVENRLASAELETFPKVRVTAQSKDVS